MDKKDIIKELLISAVENDFRVKAKLTLPFFMGYDIKISDIEVNDNLVPVAKKVQQFTYCKN